MKNPGDGKQTLIEAGTKFTGSFASDNPIVVRGTIEGEISGPSLTVADTGVVSGKVSVKELYSRGELSGEYEAENVHLSGKVRDHTVIRAKMLEVKLAVEQGGMEVVFGEVDLQVGDVPTQEKVLQDAATSGGDDNADDAPKTAVQGGTVASKDNGSAAAKAAEKKAGSSPATPNGK